MTIYAIGYGRKSFDDPEKRTPSVGDQEMFARDYANQRGWIFSEFFGDNGITGATMERPGLQAALSAIKNGRANVLIIEDVDRLSRDQEHLHYMRKILNATDTVLHTVAGGKIDDLILSMKGMMGEDQRKRIHALRQHGTGRRYPQQSDVYRSTALQSPQLEGDSQRPQGFSRSPRENAEKDWIATNSEELRSSTRICGIGSRPGSQKRAAPGIANSRSPTIHSAAPSARFIS